MAVKFNAALEAFVAEVFPAIVATKRRDGTIHMTPIWFEYHDGSFWLNSWQGSDWMAALQRDKTVALMLLDPHNVYRFAEVQGILVEATTDGADEHINQLSLRYTGNPKYQYGRPGMQRVRLKVEPTRIRSPLQQE
jgi:PPOX class probable F420-dependent enzyme